MILRCFWWIYLPCMAVVLAGYLLGSTIEGRFLPVRGEQSISAIERSGARVCWTWTFVKRRDIASPDLDAFLEVNGEPNGVTYTYDEPSGRPWGMVKFGVPARKDPYVLRQCSPLPPYVGPSDHIRIRQTALYPGWLGLWRVEVPFPDVVDPAEVKTP